MTRKSVTYKPRDDTVFNPFQETCKIIAFANEAGQSGYEKFSVFVEDGHLCWKPRRGSYKKQPGFIAVIERAAFAAGITARAWRQLEDKIAIEMCRQRKAW